MDVTTKKTLIRSIFGTVRAGLGAVATSGQQAPGRKRKRTRKSKESECTPCQAYGAVGDAYDRVRSGSL